MIRSFRAFFLSRVVREKVLLLIFVGAAVLMWFSSFNRRAGIFWRAQQATTLDLTTQKLAIDSKDKIERAAKDAAANLEPSRTLDNERLFAEVDAMGKEAGIKPILTNEPRPDDNNGQFMFHTLRVQVTNVAWEAFRPFYLALQKRSPYIIIEDFNMVAKGQQLTANFKVSSVEVARP